MLALFIEFMALWKLRISHPEIPRKRIPGGYPVLFIVTLLPTLLIILAIGSQIKDSGLTALWYPIYFIIGGAVLYWPIRHFIKKRNNIPMWIPGSSARMQRPISNLSKRARQQSRNLGPEGRPVDPVGPPFLRDRVCCTTMEAPMKVLLVGVGGVGEAIAVIAKDKPWLEKLVLTDYNLDRVKEVHKKVARPRRCPRSSSMRATRA